MFKELVTKARSYRRFDESKKISQKNLEEIVNYGRLSPSGGNLQPIKYKIINDQAIMEKVFPTIGWAGYLKEWAGPIEGERPTAYIVMLLDTDISKNAPVDMGIAVQSMFLGGSSMGIGSCMIGNFKKNQVKEILEIPDQYEISLILALGYPKETIVIDDLSSEQGSVKYYRDEEDVHHVPKRKLADIII